MAEGQGYLSKARKFWEVTEAVNDPEHTSQAVSNAILAVIAANDSVCLDRCRSDTVLVLDVRQNRHKC
jgi:hypothetical protein